LDGIPSIAENRFAIPRFNDGPRNVVKIGFNRLNKLWLTPHESVLH